MLCQTAHDVGGHVSHTRLQSIGPRRPLGFRPEVVDRPDTQPAQLYRVRTAQLVQSAGTVQEARSDSPAVGGRQAANVAQVRQGGDRKRALGVRVSSPLGARRLRVR